VTNKLTTVRQSLWDAIDNWPALATTFQKKAKNDEELPSLDLDKDAPEQDCCPAIAIWPQTEDPRWFENANQLVTATYEIRVWTNGWILEPSEEIAWEIRNAIFRSKPTGGTDTYIKTETCFGFPTIRWSFSKVRGGAKRSQNMTRMSMLVQLKFKDDPRT